MPDSTECVLSCLGLVKSCLPLSNITVSPSWQFESTESDDKDRNFFPFCTCMLEVLGVGEQRGDVFLLGLFDLRKETINGVLTFWQDLDGDRGFVWA